MAGLQSQIFALAAAEGGNADGGMPQFDPAVVEPQLVWLVITFGLLYFLMARVALPRVSRVQQDRAQRIADDLDQAEKLRGETGALEDQLETRLANARAEANKAIAAAHAEASETAKRRLAELDADLASDLGKAEMRIADACAEARAGIADMATGLCLDIVDKLADETLSEDAARAAVRAAHSETERAS